MTPRPREVHAMSLTIEQLAPIGARILGATTDVLLHDP